jgi:hypothetical protein
MAQYRGTAEAIEVLVHYIKQSLAATGGRFSTDAEQELNSAIQTFKNLDRDIWHVRGE